MTDSYSVRNRLIIELDQRSLRRAKKTLEDDLGSVTVDVNAGAGGNRARRRMQREIRDQSRSLSRLVVINADQLEVQEDILDVLQDMNDGGGSLGLDIPGLRGPAGGSGRSGRGGRGGLGSLALKALGIAGAVGAAGAASGGGSGSGSGDDGPLLPPNIIEKIIGDGGGGRNPQPDPQPDPSPQPDPQPDPQPGPGSVPDAPPVVTEPDPSPQPGGPRDPPTPAERFQRNLPDDLPTPADEPTTRPTGDGVTATERFKRNLPSVDVASPSPGEVVAGAGAVGLTSILAQGLPQSAGGVAPGPGALPQFQLAAQEDNPVSNRIEELVNGGETQEESKKALATESQTIWSTGSQPAAERPVNVTVENQVQLSGTQLQQELERAFQQATRGLREEILNQIRQEVSSGFKLGP
jgi:hypothetical protein